MMNSPSVVAVDNKLRIEPPPPLFSYKWKIFTENWKSYFEDNIYVLCQVVSHNDIQTKTLQLEVFN